MTSFAIIICPYFWPKVMVKLMRKAKEHFVMLIEICKHLPKCKSGHQDFTIQKF